MFRFGWTINKKSNINHNTILAVCSLEQYLKYSLAKKAFVYDSGGGEACARRPQVQLSTATGAAAIPEFNSN